MRGLTPDQVKSKYQTSLVLDFIRFSQTIKAQTLPIILSTVKMKVRGSSPGITQAISLSDVDTCLVPRELQGA